VSGLIPVIPGASTMVTNHIELATILRIGIAGVVAVLLLLLYPHLSYLIGFYLRGIFWKQGSDASFDANVAAAQSSVLLFGYVCVLYWALVPSMGLLIINLTGHKSLTLLLRLLGFFTAIAALIRAVVAISRLITVMSVSVSDRLVAATEAALTTQCAGCGARNERGSNFCKSCGQKLSPRNPESPLSVGQAKCAACGAVVVADAKYCPSCGKPSPQQ
jgi:RNA polymerase subunit RPABC4/transcription elongation factor Spt4